MQYIFFRSQKAYPCFKVWGACCADASRQGQRIWAGVQCMWLVCFYNGVFPFGLLPFCLLPTPFLHVSRDQSGMGMFSEQISMTHSNMLKSATGMFSEQISMTYTLTQNMLVKTSLVWACSVNKVSKSISVHPSLLIWQR